jgi:hypothetical protein
MINQASEREKNERKSENRIFHLTLFEIVQCQHRNVPYQCVCDEKEPCRLRKPQSFPIRHGHFSCPYFLIDGIMWRLKQISGKQGHKRRIHEEKRKHASKKGTDSTFLLCKFPFRHQSSSSCACFLVCIYVWVMLEWLRRRHEKIPPQILHYYFSSFPHTNFILGD